jgi:ribonuclease Z
MLDVCLLGTSGMMPLPGRWLTALMTRFNGSGLLIDCGEGTQITIKEKGWSFHSIDVICFTHYHGDHIAGLPGLLLSMGNADRTETVTLIGPKGLERIVSSLRVIAPELPFELRFVELNAQEETIEINGYTIKAFKVKHNVTCYGYSILIKRGGRFYTEMALKNNVPQKYWSQLQNGGTIIDGDIVYIPEMVLGPERKGIKLTYCTDTRPTKLIVDNAKASDLFICEGMYGEKDKASKAKEYKHMTFCEAAEIARAAGVSELWLTHYSPSMVRPGDFIKDAREIFSNTRLGKDRKSVILQFDKNE